MANSVDQDQLKPTDLNLHCLQRQGISGSAGLQLMLSSGDKIFNRCHFEIFFPENMI